MILTLNVVLLASTLFVLSCSVKAQDESLNFEDKPAPIYYPPKMKIVSQVKEINCDNFSGYASNCAKQASSIYNSNRKSPPMPVLIQDWCRAIKHLTNCAVDWNTDCREVTDSHFNEESINGHSYVVHNICDDKSLIEKYNKVTSCVNATSDKWEKCYTTFKNLVDSFKRNTSSDWTHYETHFQLCCGRAIFRRCVLNVVFDPTLMDCSREQAVTLQRFSVIVSEGDVYQDCDFNMVYKNCPGGDPRPNDYTLGLLRIDELDKKVYYSRNAQPKYLSYASTISSPGMYWAFLWVFLKILL